MIKCIMDPFYVATLTNVNGVVRVDKTLGFSVRTNQNVCSRKGVSL